MGDRKPGAIGNTNGNSYCRAYIPRVMTVDLWNRQAFYNAVVDDNPLKKSDFTQF